MSDSKEALFFKQAKHLNSDNAWAAYNKVRNQVTSEKIYGSFQINELVNQLQDAIYYCGYNRNAAVPQNTKY